MNRFPGAIDVGVVIGRVRLCSTPAGGRVPAAEPPRPAPARAGDHRIVVRELCIETDTRLPEHEARQLGGRIAQALAERLRALQSRRLGALLAGRSREGAVRIGTLRVLLRGGEAARPDAGAIASVLSDAVQQRSAP